MKSPLRIFTKDQIQNLNPYNLRRLKKEFFIPFKFGNATSVVINDHEVDKDTLEGIFEELEANLDDYLIVVKNEVLVDFFESGKIYFLFNPDKHKEIKDLIKTDPKLEEQIAYKLSYVIANTSQNISGTTRKSLNSILKFTSDFSNANKIIAYQKCYDTIEAQLDKITSEYENPFENSKGINYKSEVGMHIDFFKAQLFDYLPKSFETLDKKYSTWCYYSIVLRSIVRQTNLNKYTKRQLKIFIEASKISSRHFDPTSLEYNLKAAEEALKGGKSNFGFSSLIAIVLFVFALLKIVTSIADLDSFDSRNNKPKTQEEIVAEYKEKMRSLHQEKIKNNHRESSSKESQLEESKTEDKTSLLDYKEGISILNLSKDYSGNKWQLINAEHRRIKAKKDTIVITYESEIFPTLNYRINNFLPKSFSSESSTNGKIAKVEFKNFDLNLKTSHYLNLELNENEELKYKSYQSKRSDTNSKLKLNVKKIPYSTFNVKGYIMRKMTNSGKLNEKVDFTIRYIREKKLFKINYGDKQSLELKKSEIEKPNNIESNNGYYKKFAILINNLNLPHNKYLSKGKLYSINNIAEYMINSGSKLNTNPNELSIESGEIRFNFTSIADNLAYCEINTKRTAIKYIVDHRTGNLKGMTRVVVSDNRDEVEQIIVVRQ